MLLGRDRKLEAAAQGTRQRIRKDREKASVRLKPLLNHIEPNLFDPKLDSKTLMRRCNVRDKSIPTAFTRELKAAPATYIRDRRMETVVRLLVDTDLYIWEIGELVFGRDLNNFSKRFTRWSGGTAPKAYRKAAREAAAEAESLEHPLREVARAILRDEALELDADQIDRLIRHLQASNAAKSTAKSTPAPRPLTIDGPTFERGIALAFWEQLRYLPAKEQQELVRQPYSLPSTALFDVLREKSREEGRKDRQAGVRLAETAVASLDGIAAFLTPEELANRKAQGWAWLGNARRLALDFPAAKRAFAKARKLLPVDPDLEVLAEICALEGELYLFQSKFKEALELKDHAVELFRSLGKIRPLAEALLSRAITNDCNRGSGAAIPDFLEAIKVAELVKDPHLWACAHQGLITAYALAGHTEEALQRLPVARAHCANTEDRIVAYHLQWAESFIARQQGRPELAEELLLAVGSGFVAIGETLFAATVDLDLAELYLEQGRESEAVSHALGAIPVFEHFDNQPEAVAALALLGDVAAEQSVSLEVVRMIRSHLAQLGQIPIGLRN